MVSTVKADLHGAILSHATSLRHAYDTLGHDCRKVLELFTTFFRVVRRLHATKLHHVNRPLGIELSDGMLGPTEGGSE